MQEFDDPFDLHRHSSPSGRQDQDGREIRFLGSPILALDPATNHFLRVDEFARHPLVAGRYFYTLPAGLWDALTRALGEQQFDSELLRMERAFSELCGDHSMNVGVWEGRWVNYSGLRPLPAASVSDEEARAAGRDPIAVNNALRIHQESNAPAIYRFQGGYAGWLLTNQQFLNEHDVLLAEHAAVVRRWGTHHAGFVPPGQLLLPGTNPADDPQWPEFNSACEAFFTRWRLLRLAGPYLPVPLPVLLAGSFPWTVTEQLMRAGGVFYLPDTMPVPSRDQLRGMLECALHRGERPEHLEEWLTLVRGSNPARNPLDRFARLFQVQHFWRILHERHRASLQNRLVHAEGAMAEFSGVSAETMRTDFREIRRRLGRSWLDRQSPL